MLIEIVFKNACYGIMLNKIEIKVKESKKLKWYGKYKIQKINNFRYNISFSTSPVSKVLYKTPVLPLFNFSITLQEKRFCEFF